MRKYLVGVGVLVVTSCSGETPGGDASSAAQGCPATGEPLQLMPVIQSIADEPCTSYTHSAQASYAVADCKDVGLSGGPIGGPLDAIAAMGIEPRVVPEGDELVVKRLTILNPGDSHRLYMTSWRRYTRDANGAFIEADQVVTPATETSLDMDRYSLSTRTRRPDDRVMFIDRVRQTVSELMGGSEVTSYTQQDLGLASPAEYVQLSPDGLRILIKGGFFDAVYFSDRASLTDRFRTATRLDLVPTRVESPFLSDDCSRLYYTGSEYGVVMYQEAR